MFICDFVWIMSLDCKLRISLRVLKKILESKFFVMFNQCKLGMRMTLSVLFAKSQLCIIFDLDQPQLIFSECVP